MASDQTRNSKPKREQWRQIINDWKHSECKTQAAFCRQSGISIKSFARCRSVFAHEALEKAPAPGFATVAVLSEQQGVESGVCIHLPYGMHIAVTTSFDAATLQRVLGVFK